MYTDNLCIIKRFGALDSHIFTKQHDDSVQSCVCVCALVCVCVCVKSINKRKKIGDTPPHTHAPIHSHLDPHPLLTVRTHTPTLVCLHKHFLYLWPSCMLVWHAGLSKVGVQAHTCVCVGGGGGALMHHRTTLSGPSH